MKKRARTSISSIAFCILCFWLGSRTGVHAQAFAIPPSSNQMRAPTANMSRYLPAGVKPDQPRFEGVLNTEGRSAGSWGLLGLLDGYRNGISVLNGRQSDLAPVHSLYAHQAIVEYGALRGVILSTARLLHESAEYPLLIKLPPRDLGYDPLWANTWWWSEP